MDYRQFKSYFLSVGIGIFTFKLDNVDYCLSRAINVNHGKITRGEGYYFTYLNNKIFVKNVSLNDRSFEEVFPLLKDMYINEMTEEEFIRTYCNLDYDLLDLIAEFNLGKFVKFDSLKDCLLNNEKNDKNEKQNLLDEKSNNKTEIKMCGNQFKKIFEDFYNF